MHSSSDSPWRACARLGILAAIPLAFGLAGCAMPDVLREKPQVPVFISSYASQDVRSYTKSLKCSLNLVNCVKSAAVGEKTISGKTVSEQTFGIGAIIQSEFSSAVESNFTPIKGSEQPDVELRVDTQRVRLTLDGGKFRFLFAASVKLVNPKHADKPYFSNLYTASATSRKVDREFVPDCVYEGVQSVLAQFLSDLAKDESRLTGLSCLKQ